VLRSRARPRLDLKEAEETGLTDRISSSRPPDTGTTGKLGHRAVTHALAAELVPDDAEDGQLAIRKAVGQMRRQDARPGKPLAMPKPF
jgi:hypothetical protein